MRKATDERGREGDVRHKVSRCDSY
jgi:hypothetical protein